MIPRTCQQAEQRARLHGLAVAGDGPSDSYGPLIRRPEYGAAITCPICNNGIQWVILWEDAGQLSTIPNGCNGCGSHGYEIALALSDPPRPQPTPEPQPKPRVTLIPTIHPPRTYAPR